MRELKFGPPVFITEITEDFRKNLLSEGIQQKRDARPQLAGHIENEKYYSDVLINKYSIPILNKVNEYVEKIKIDRNTKDISYKLTLNGLWINRQTFGEHNPPHRHINGQISFVIYLNFPDEIKNEKMFSPRTYQPGTISFLYGGNTQLDLNDNNQFVNNILSPIDIKEHMPTNGEMIIFPSYLIHYVSPFYTKGIERVSVSGNVGIIETKIKTII